MPSPLASPRAEATAVAAEARPRLVLAELPPEVLGLDPDDPIATWCADPSDSAELPELGPVEGAELPPGVDPEAPEALAQGGAEGEAFPGLSPGPCPACGAVTIATTGLGFCHGCGWVKLPPPLAPVDLAGLPPLDAAAVEASPGPALGAAGAAAVALATEVLGAELLGVRPLGGAARRAPSGPAGTTAPGPPSDRWALLPPSTLPFHARPEVQADPRHCRGCGAAAVEAGQCRRCGCLAPSLPSHPVHLAKTP